MKKRIFLTLFIAALIFSGCSQKVAPVKVTREVTKITEEEFVIDLCQSDAVQNLQPGGALIVFTDSTEVKGLSGWYAYAEPFNPGLRYYQLLVLNEKVPLTIKWDGGPKSHLPIDDYADLFNNYGPNEKLIICQPMPRFHVIIGTKEYWVGNGGKLWATN